MKTQLPSATRNYDERFGKVIRDYDWVTADGMCREQARYYLCDLGEVSDGWACYGCESQCAFGRAYNGYSAKRKYTRKDRGRVLRCTDPEGRVVGEWKSVREACYDLGYKWENKLKDAIRRKKPYYDQIWIWVEVVQ